jgi:cytochrome c oxidase cbb3-type subunit I
MTVKPRVNPKKLRPYDEPPKRKRRLVPDAPDSAATGFFVAASLWLALAGGLGLLAIGMRIVPVSFSFPFGFFDLGFEFDERRVDYAFINATVYGWLSNAAFAAIAFMLPRLTGRRLALEKLLMVAVAFWNLSLMGGIASLYVFDLGAHSPLTAMLWLFDGGMATAAFIVLASLALTVRTSFRGLYVSVWFAAVALLGLLGLLTVDALGGIADWWFGLDDLLVALGSAAVDRGVIVLWLLGMAYATLHYVVPRAAQAPLASGGVALLTFLTWAALAPASVLAVLADVNVPYLLTTIGEVATMLLVVPAGLAVGNLVSTLSSRWSVLFGSGTGALASISLAFLFATSMLDAIGALRDVNTLVANTEWESGVFLWAAFGTFTFAALALADHALPRMLKRAWDGSMLSGATMWLAFGGATIAGLALMGGGLAQGSLGAQASDLDAVRSELVVYRGAALAGFGLVALAGLAMLVNLFLMYTTAKPVAYAAPGQTAPAAGH